MPFEHNIPAFRHLRFMLPQRPECKRFTQCLQSPTTCTWVRRNFGDSQWTWDKYYSNTIATPTTTNSVTFIKCDESAWGACVDTTDNNEAKTHFHSLSELQLTLYSVLLPCELPLFLTEHTHTDASSWSRSCVLIVVTHPSTRAKAIELFIWKLG